MSFSYIVWDKKTDINGCAASDYLANHSEVGDTDEVVLVSQDGGPVLYIVNATSLRGELSLADTVDAIDVATTYMNKIQEDNAKAAAAVAEQQSIKDKLSAAVQAGTITAEIYKSITGEDYVAPTTTTQA